MEHAKPRFRKTGKGLLIYNAIFAFSPNTHSTTQHQTQKLHKPMKQILTITLQ